MIRKDRSSKYFPCTVLICFSGVLACTGIRKMQRIESLPQQHYSPTKDWTDYLPDTQYIEHLPLLTVRINVHVLDTVGTYPDFDIDRKEAYRKYIQRRIECQTFDNSG